MFSKSAAYYDKIYSQFEYLVGTPGKIDHEIETHELGLFSIEEMKQCFKKTGLMVTFDEEGISGRGLYMAHKG